MKRRSDYWRDKKRAKESNAAFYELYKAIKAETKRDENPPVMTTNNSKTAMYEKGYTDEG